MSFSSESTAPARRVLVIGIGAGSPQFVTQQAISALNEVDVFLVADKGETKDELVALRRTICDQFIEASHSYEIRALVDPERGPDADRGTAEYEAAVRAWHEARAAAYAAQIAALPAGAVVGFLVWGDPAFYDSTIRIVDSVAASLPLVVTVVPGISAFQALAAAHGMVLHPIGQSVHITTGRRLVSQWRSDLGTVVVMLDGGLACRDLVSIAPDLIIHWGAYVGLPQQVLRSGRLADLIDELIALRASLRAEHGWIMDVYSLSSPAKVQ